MQEMSREGYRALLEKMWLARRFEEELHRLFAAGEVHGTTHLYIGEEAVAAGVTAALEPADVITSTHRGHGHCVAKGTDAGALMAEILGREAGCCRGRGGSMHLADFSRGNLGANGVVGGGLPIAAGAALAIRMRGEDRVAVSFFGDGAANEGSFHEALNLASVWKLPVIFVCEDNKYGMSTGKKHSMNISDIAVRAQSYGIPGIRADGMDALDVWEKAAGAREYAREHGPALLVCDTYRFMGHSKSDKNVYRTQDEIDEWRAKDPILRLENQLADAGVFTRAELEEIEREADGTIARAVEFARQAAQPAAGDLGRDVYAEECIIHMEKEPGGGNAGAVSPTTKMTYARALREAMSGEMRRDAGVFLLGEDVGEYGGAFGVSAGMVEEFGPERVRNTPISEAAIAGAAVGAALMGMRPVAEMIFSDFSTIAMDQVVNQAAKMRYMFGGQAGVPMVLRMPSGSGTGAAAQHSQSLEAWFCHVPGLKVVAASTPADAKGLLAAAIRDPDPVIFFEQKLLYKEEGEVPDGEYVLPLGKAHVAREGADVTVVTYGRMLGVCLEAAARAAERGVSVEVIDPRTLYPMDMETIARSVRKTGRAVVVHEACKTGGLGGEIAAAISERAFSALKAPVARVCGADVPVPFSPGLEAAVAPDAGRVFEEILRIAG